MEVKENTIDEFSLQKWQFLMSLKVCNTSISPITQNKRLEKVLIALAKLKIVFEFLDEQQDSKKLNWKIKQLKQIFQHSEFEKALELFEYESEGKNKMFFCNLLETNIFEEKIEEIEISEKTILDLVQSLITSSGIFFYISKLHR